MKTVALELQVCCGERSGIGNYAYELARRLVSDKDLRYQGNLFNFLGRNDNAEALTGVQIPLCVNRTMPYGIYRRLWDVVPFSYANMFSSADLSHFFNYVVPPRVSGKVITTIHDMACLRYPETMDSRNLRRIRNGIKYSIERSDYILTISEFSKREIIELLNVPSSKLGIVYYAASISDRTANFASVSEKSRITRPYILYVGTIEPRKNLERLIAAYNQLRGETGLSHQLVLAGGTGWKNADIHRAAEASPYRKDILFTGYISNPVKNTLYQNASVFAYPSLYEGFGIPPLEAMAFGAPVICSDAASIPEVVGDAALKVKSLDTGAIAEGLYQILSSPDYASNLRTLGYERVKKFSWDNSSKRLAEIYKTVLIG